MPSTQHHTDPELHAWAHRAFRPAKLHGRLPTRPTWRALGNVTLGPRTEIERGRLMLGPAAVALGAASIVGVSFLIGRWWARRHPPETIMGGLELLGCD